MTSSDSSPKLPIWIFLVTDAALLSAAAFIASTSARPLSTTAILAIVACVIAGAIVLLVPLVARYERQKNETLDERQRAIEALASTVSSSAEQISIAANGLHEIVDLVHKNLRHAEQLPHKLQDKIAAFQAQLASASDTEKEELEKELVSLRSSESERLDAVSTKIAKTAAELAKLESATQQHLTAANEAISKLSMGTAAAIGKAQAAAEQALAQARIEAARHLGETAGNASRAIETAKASALADLNAQLAAATPTLVDQLLRALSTKVPGAPSSTPLSAPPAEAATDAPATGQPTTNPGKTEGTSQPPKRPRKMRREEPEEPSSAEAPNAASSSTPPAAPTDSGTDVPAAPENSPSSAPKEEPTPIPADKIPEITPVAPHTTQPFPPPPAPPTETTSPAAPAPSADAPASAASASSGPAQNPAESPKISRRRTGKKTEPDASAEEPALDLGIQEPPATNGTAEKTLTSDGATRLLVTSYIGIGNRLFIRGAGPGLSWEKGTPLQFVSIGKWRWETNDATAPVQFKLYKNDDLECTTLGAQSVDPGYQQEVTAAF